MNSFFGHHQMFCLAQGQGTNHALDWKCSFAAGSGRITEEEEVVKFKGSHQSQTQANCYTDMALTTDYVLKSRPQSNPELAAGL